VVATPGACPRLDRELSGKMFLGVCQDVDRERLGLEPDLNVLNLDGPATRMNR
jgi:hypothetical protein